MFSGGVEMERLKMDELNLFLINSIDHRFPLCTKRIVLTVHCS